MHYLQYRIFGPRAEKVQAAVLQDIRKVTLAEDDQSSLARDYVECGVRLGIKIAEKEPSSFIEVGCGLGIPSLTLAALNVPRGMAFDNCPEIIDQGQELAAQLGLNLRYERIDFYSWKLPSDDTFLIADKFRGESPGVELVFLARTMQRRLPFAMVPAAELDPQLEARVRLDTEYVRQLQGRRYQVETVHLLGNLPLNAIIAIPQESMMTRRR